MKNKELNDLLEEFARWLELKLFRELNLDKSDSHKSEFDMKDGRNEVDNE